ncbi:MAG: hypothetical protein PHW04_18575 [Candidatus Wallbacteria bacterium]|nr:hypothetical protein [Candidatus Wallbacteria bacterium]
MRYLYLLFFTILFLEGCNDPRVDQLKSEIEALKTENDGRKIEIFELSQKLKALNITSEIQSINEALELHKAQSRITKEPGSYVLNFSNREVQLMETEYGFFPINFLRSEAFSNGYKVKFLLANTLNVSLGDLTFRVRWGKRPDDYIDLDEWRKQLQVKDMKPRVDLKSGSWNYLELYLLPAKAENIQYVEVRLIAGTTSLAAP